ncbi:MAG TPA: hypothetical protein VGD37_27815 [Kofleriaceae bacterium]|jgi:hypothetical protein
MMKTSQDQKPKKLTLNKATLRILGKMQIARVNGGDGGSDACVQSLDFPCPNPEIMTSPC